MCSRCVSINSQLEHEFTSNLVYPQSILIEDINEDGKNEIIIGTSNGEIYVLYTNRGTSYQSWLKYPSSSSQTPKIGSITCLAFDNITNSKKKFLIVHDSIGYVYLICLEQVYSGRKRYCSDISPAIGKCNPNDWKAELRVVYHTKLIINPKCLIIDDLNNNGLKQMIVGYSDRTVRVYNWINNNQNNSSSSASVNQASNTAYSLKETDRFALVNSWELIDQINSIHVVRDYLSPKDLIVTQPGGVAVLCKLPPVVESKLESNSSSASSLADLAINQTASTSLKSSSFTNSFEEIVNFSSEITSFDSNRNNVPTFLVPNVNFNKSNTYAYMVTMNGDIFFFKLSMNNVTNKAPIWHRSINNIIVMKCHKLDINNDCNDELMIATPDGQIFAVNSTGDIICFDLGEPIKAFHLGLYQSELFTSTVSLIDPAASSENDLYQSNQGEFELVLDGSFQTNDSATVNNCTCVVFISAITSKICLLQTEAILPYSKSKPSQSQFRYKCENVFSKRYFNPKLTQALDQVKTNPLLLNDLIHDILYSN